MEQAEARHDQSPKRVRSGSWAAAQVTLHRAPAPRSVFAHPRVAVSPNEWVRGCQSDSRVGGVSPPSPRWRTSQCQLHGGRAPAVSRAPRGVSQARWAIPPRRSHPLISNHPPGNVELRCRGSGSGRGGPESPFSQAQMWGSGEGTPLEGWGDQQPRTPKARWWCDGGSARNNSSREECLTVSRE